MKILKPLESLLVNPWRSLLQALGIRWPPTEFGTTDEFACDRDVRRMRCRHWLRRTLCMARSVRRRGALRGDVVGMHRVPAATPIWRFACPPRSAGAAYGEARMPCYLLGFRIAGRWSQRRLRRLGKRRRGATDQRAEKHERQDSGCKGADPTAPKRVAVRSPESGRVLVAYAPPLDELMLCTCTVGAEGRGAFVSAQAPVKGAPRPLSGPRAFESVVRMCG